MSDQRTNGHTVSRLIAHVVWSTKYRYSILDGDIQQRCRTILIQVYYAVDIVILKGIVSNDHIHMHIEYRLSQSLSNIVKKLKGEVQGNSNRNFQS